MVMNKKDYKYRWEKMNEETIEFRLDQIEKKLDAVTDILLQTNQQEIRLSNLEKKIEKNVDRWLNPLVSAVISGIVAFVFVKVGIR